MLRLFEKSKKNNNFKCFDFYKILLENGDIPISILKGKLEMESMKYIPIY